MTQEELLQKIGELIDRKLDQKIETKIRPLVKEEIHAGNAKVIEELSKSMADYFHETWERMDKQDERITALEEHTGLTKHN